MCAHLLDLVHRQNVFRRERQNVKVSDVIVMQLGRVRVCSLMYLVSLALLVVLQMFVRMKRDMERI